MIIIAPAAPDLSHDIARALAAPPSYRAPDSLPAEETQAAIARALASPHTYRTPLPAQHAPELAESPPSQDQPPSSDQESETLSVLWQCWQRGDSTRTAATAAGVSQSTASRQYRLFKYGAMAAQRPPR